MLPKFNDNELPQLFMNALKSLANEENPVNVPQTIDRDLFFIIGLNVEICKSSSPKKHCQGPNGGVDAKITAVSKGSGSASVIMMRRHTFTVFLISGSSVTLYPGKYTPVIIFGFLDGASNEILFFLIRGHNLCSKLFFIKNVFQKANVK